MPAKIIEVEAETSREAKAQVKSQMPEGFHALMVIINPYREPTTRNEQTIQSEADSLEEARERLKSQMPEGVQLFSEFDFAQVESQMLEEVLFEEIISDGEPTITNKQTIQSEADSVEEAREQLKSQTPEGFQLLSEKIISDGKPTTVKAVADTTEAAFAKAQSRIPNNAYILEKKELVPSERKMITVEAFDEQTANSNARAEASKQFGSTAVVQSLKLAMTGKKGFLGIGKKPDQYEAEILVRQATVEVSYKPKAKISADIGEVYKPKVKISADIGEMVYKPKAKFSAIISDITMDERESIRYSTDYPDQSLKNASFLISMHGKPIGIYIGSRGADIYFRDGTEYFLGGFKVGYRGTGPDYSQRLLALAGFHISMDEIAESPYIFFIAEQDRE